MTFVAPVEAGARQVASGGRKRRAYPVAVHLAQCAAGVLLPVLAIVAFMLVDHARVWREDSLYDARVIAHHLNATIEVELEKAIAVGQTLAGSLTYDDGDLARFDALARDAGSRLGMTIVAQDWVRNRR